MATSASQTYISRLGFQDKDRANSRHGLACEYLFERLLELEVTPYMLNKWKDDIQNEIIYQEKQLLKYCNNDETLLIKEEISKLKDQNKILTTDFVIKKIKNTLRVGECVNVPIGSRSYVNGFADVLIACKDFFGDSMNRIYGVNQNRWLGEVKITKEPAENILQQINFYLNFLENVESVYILTDYDPSDLQRLCLNTKIKVFRLGSRFEQWLCSRVHLTTNEL